MARNGFTPDRRGFGQMLRSPGMRAAMVACAHVVEERAREVVDTRSGAYARSLSVTSTTRGGPLRDRAQASVVSTDPGALSIEYGTHVRGRRQAQHPLRSGLDALRTVGS